MTNTPVIINLPFKFLLGLKIQTSVSENKTKELWQSFGPLQKEIKNRVGQKTYSVEIYEPGFEMNNFTPTTRFEKWAAVEVSGFEYKPKRLETLTIPEGMYAKFIFKGLHKDFMPFAQYIFTEWLPVSGYKLDDRPHFEVLGEKYHGPFNPESEEEIWIPIK